MPVLTNILVLLALVDVLQNRGDLIGPVSWTPRTQFLELFATNFGALLASIAPSVTDATAARRFCYRRGHVEDALWLSGTVFKTGETE